MLFNEKKAAQVAAFFVHKSKGSINVLKLMKLMYLSERKSFARYGEPIIGDRLVSMDYGPVLSRTLNHINGGRPSGDKGWNYWIAARARHTIGLGRKLDDPNKQLLELSDAEFEILELMWKEYGHLDAFALAELTHKICSEWEDPEGSAKDIPYQRLLAAVGFSEDIAAEVEARIADQDELQSRIAAAIG
jgi:uncharacterized phage-associated protein